MTETYAALRTLLSEAGCAFVEPPVVHPASVFVELAGEDLRRQLFLTSAADGTELALRPDYTIPVCLQHLASGPASRSAAPIASPPTPTP
jgi:ATP phosphoribosyltransferase regulatory subunit